MKQSERAPLSLSFSSDDIGEENDLPVVIIVIVYNRYRDALESVSAVKIVGLLGLECILEVVDSCVLESLKREWCGFTLNETEISLGDCRSCCEALNDETKSKK